VNLKGRITLPHAERIKYWLKLITVTGTAQAIVQAVGFLSGILVIRLLSVDEYALYTLANTMLGAMILLSDGGISTGVMAQGGKVWQDRQKLGAVLATGLDLRRKFATFSLIVSLPILWYLLLHHGATWITTVLITVSLIPPFYASLSDVLLQVPIKLHQAIVPLQRNQVNVSVGRLLLTGITLFAFPWAFVAIISSGIPRILGNIKLRKIAYGITDKEQKPDAEERKEILKIVKKMLPISIYYAFSGQISVWLISMFGNTSSIAEIGALSKIAILFTLLNSLLGTLLVPRYAKLNNEKALLLKRYLQTISLVSILIMIIILTVYIFSDQILWLLGKNYTQLHYELLLNIISCCLINVTGVAFLLYGSRGWLLPPITSLLINVIPLIAGCCIFDVSTLVGVLYLNIFVAFVPMLIHIGFGVYKIQVS
jgi:O-antigen/teichoic acid export membrane protein